MRRVDEVLEVPIQIKPAHLFHAALEIVRPGVLEFPIAVIRLQPFIAEFRSHHGGQLRQQRFAFGIRSHAVGTVGLVVVGVGDQRLFVAAKCLADVARKRTLMRWLVAARTYEEVTHAQFGSVAGHAFVHVLVQALVGGQQSLEPRVGHFVDGHPNEAPEAALPCDERGHRVLHAAVAALDDRVLRVGVGTNEVAEKGHGLGRVFR